MFYRVKIRNILIVYISRNRNTLVMSDCPHKVQVGSVLLNNCFSFLEDTLKFLRAYVCSRAVLGFIVPAGSSRYGKFLEADIFGKFRNASRKLNLMESTQTSGIPEFVCRSSSNQTTLRMFLVCRIFRSSLCCIVVYYVLCHVAVLTQFYLSRKNGSRKLG